MVSGQPGQMPQGPYPTYQPVYQVPHKPMVEYARSAVSDVFIVVLVSLALFLMWLGTVMWGSWDADDKDWGAGVASFGMLILTWTLFVGGALRHDLDKWLRIAMVLGAVVLLAFVGYWYWYSALMVDIPWL